MFWDSCGEKAQDTVGLREKVMWPGRCAPEQKGGNGTETAARRV